MSGSGDGKGNDNDKNSGGVRNPANKIPKNTQILELRKKYNNKKNFSNQVPIIEAFGKIKVEPNPTKQAQ